MVRWRKIRKTNLIFNTLEVLERFLAISKRISNKAYLRLDKVLKRIEFHLIKAIFLKLI